MKAKALDQWNREIPIVPERGKITDRNGKVLAGNITSYAVFIRSNAVKDKVATASLVAKALQIDLQPLLDKLNSSKVSEITVARQVDKERIEELASYGLEGVYFSRDNTRIYPYGNFLCQELGFTSSDNAGVSGIEKYYDKYLCGSNGELLYATDLVGVELNNAVAKYMPAVDGLNVKLTIDYDIQAIAENAMKNVFMSSNPQSAECIVLDPNNFEILGMVNYPGYDLNDVPRDDMELLNKLSRNHLVCDIYEPGSTFKVVTAAADVEEYLQGNTNAFSLTHIFSSARTRTVDGTTIKCWCDHRNGKHSNQTLADALNNSCNPCFTDIALALGKETMYNYLDKYNFGQITGIDYAGEALGMVVSESCVRDCDLARIGFGQTIAVTGLQLACAVGATVNGGYYYTPHLVREIKDNNGKIKECSGTVIKNRTVSEKTSKIMCGMLEGVVKEGSGKKAYIEGYKVGGKTGTAQKYEDGHIASGKYVSSFAGFFPADNPKYLALIIVDEPQGVYYGSTIAAPCAKEIFQGIIDVKNIKPYE